MSIFLLPAPLAYACMGCVLLARRPGHPMGPLLCLIGLADAIATVPYTYVRYALVHSPGSLPFSTAALWMNTWAYAPATSLGGMVLLLVFPDGQAAVAAVPARAVGGAGVHPAVHRRLRLLPAEPGPAVPPPAQPVRHPPARLARSRRARSWPSCAAVVAAAGAVASVTLRWRRADRVGRQQLKWLLATLPFTIASLIATLVFPGTWSLVLALPAGILMPIAIGIAVLRYRLYEIDILLNRAVLYGLLTAGMAGVYLAVVVVAQSSARCSACRAAACAVQVIATVLAASALWPLHDRVQRAGGPAVLRRPGRTLRGPGPARPPGRGGGRPRDRRCSSVVKTIADSLRLPYAALELRLGDGWSPAAAHGEAPPQVVAFPLTFQRETVGRLLVGTRSRGEQLGPDDERLLADLARQAGPAAHAVALRRALDASRAGLVTAREEERRRLRRDLHDGLGPTLAGLTLGLDTARARSASQPELQELLGKLKAETQRAVADVRRIVYGLRPPTLDEFGLVGSLREEVGRLQYEAPSLTVTLDAPADGLADLPAAVEVACYRIVTEALTNVTRHAHATQCSVRLRLNHGLDVNICDDGVGLPEGWRAGVGIASMRERVTELGGDLVIEPSLPHGTRINAYLPAREQP